MRWQFWCKWRASHHGQAGPWGSFVQRFSSMAVDSLTAKKRIDRIIYRAPFSLPWHIILINELFEAKLYRENGTKNVSMNNMCSFHMSQCEIFWYSTTWVQRGAFINQASLIVSFPSLLRSKLYLERAPFHQYYKDFFAKKNILQRMSCGLCFVLCQTGKGREWHGCPSSTNSCGGCYWRFRSNVYYSNINLI
jgi:hypothetical protein